jgi:hypothetical protein
MDVPQAPAHSRFTQSHGDEYLQQQQQGKGGGKGARGMGRRRWASNGSPVREWLLRQAAVHPCFADQVLAVLEAEEVLSLDDLRLLAGHPHFDSCGLPVLTVLQIRKALASQQPQSQSQQSPLALAPQRLALPWYRPPALPTSNERALHMSNERALGVDDDSAASATTAAQIESDLSWGEADDCLVDWLEATSDNYAALRASALTRSQGAVSLHEAAAAAQAAWGWQLRPTPPRLGAIAAFALGVHHTRTGVAVGAPMAGSRPVFGWSNTALAPATLWSSVTV